MGEHVQVAGGLVFTEREDGVYVLLLDDRFGKVSMPKGHVEAGEILEETAVREVNEETGITTRVVTPLGLVTYDFVEPSTGEPGIKDAYYYLLEKTGGNINPQLEEVQGARFVPLNTVETEVKARGYDNNVALFQKGIAMIRGLTGQDLELASRIDHTLLRPDATQSEIERLCKEAAAYQFASVCVNPLYVEAATAFLAHSPVKVCSVIGFPLGATVTEVKVAEAKRALQDGAQELDMVIQIGQLRLGNLAAVEADIRAVVETAGDLAIVKVILETGLLTPLEQVLGSECAMRAGAHFVKTSTGFGAGGATVEAVQRLRKTVGGRLGVKASGGIKTSEDARAMLAAGATRIGASAGPKLVQSELFRGWDN